MRITSSLLSGIQTRDCLGCSPVALLPIFFPVFLALVVGFRYNVFCIVTALGALKSRYRVRFLAQSFYNGCRARSASYSFGAGCSVTESTATRTWGWQLHLVLSWRRKAKALFYASVRGRGISHKQPTVVKLGGEMSWLFLSRCGLCNCTFLQWHKETRTRAGRCVAMSKTRRIR
jgi:hypothetical protein